MMAGSGCRTAGFHARSLPPELAAPQVHSGQHVNLSRLTQATTKNELIYAGDTVLVAIATGLEVRSAPTWSLRVAEDGTVNVPLVGRIGVAGLQLTNAERVIHNESVRRGVYRDPQVSVTIESRRSNKVTVLGAVQKQGPYELPSNSSDLLSALVAAGGLSKDADTVVEIRHAPDSGPEGLASGQPGADAAANPEVSLASYAEGRRPQRPSRSVRIDLNAADATSGSEFQLTDGSVVMVMNRPEQTIHVAGLVKRPGQFDVPADQDLRLLDAVSLAGGLRTEIADKVLIVRNLPGRAQPVTILASINRAKYDPQENLRLAGGDLITVEETPLTFIVDELSRFVRFGITAGTRFTAF